MLTSGNETKPGVYTTEFWSMLLLQVMGLLQLTGAWDYVPDSSNKYVALGMAILGGFYTVSRGKAKQGVAYDPNANTPPQ